MHSLCHSFLSPPQWGCGRFPGPRLGVSKLPAVLHRAQPPEGLLNPLLTIVHEVGLEPPHEPLGRHALPVPVVEELVLEVPEEALAEDMRASLAADRAVPPAPVAAARPRGQARAGRRQVGGGVHALAAPFPRRHQEPERRHLGAHRRGRPAQLPRDLPARGPALQHPLNRAPLVPGEPAVGPRGRFTGPRLSFCGHAVLRSPRAGRSGPQGIGFPHSSVHIRMNEGSVRMKLPIKDQRITRSPDA